MSMTTTKTLKIGMCVLFVTMCVCTYLDYIHNQPVDFWTIGMAVMILGLCAYAIKYEPDDEDQDQTCRITNPKYYRNARWCITNILIGIMGMVAIILFTH